ncbi:beta-N-acetylhexosaminidase [Athalassotoga saccharophila]|uniref:beta-N-acetylhexosaminidase n=1 Tax=Athalassotoga saccharophila TaxID=1441386 RepID=UPI0013798936|nr:beta-N-acetylhexosaminidase [Athalassotoga saccharophila]BBJ28444.1 beta-hexosaminidase [Athalassotoga saccharophila]
MMIVPEPKMTKIGKERYSFDGFSNLPSFLKKEFGIKDGKWKIEKIDKAGSGLKITDGKVQIWGDELTPYATLIQILNQSGDFLPEIEVEESFRFEFRGYHLDIARGGVPNLKTFKALLRWLFLTKYNYFAIYFEDLFPWKIDPKIGEHRGRLTADEVDEIIDYGKSLGIEVFPSLELTGHMEHILSLPEYREFSEWHRPSEGCLDLSNDKASDFAMKLLEEVVEFFPSKHIHIGGDETWALGRGKSLNKGWEFQGHKLYESHYDRMIKIVKSHGKIPMMWGDMLTGMYLTKAESEKWQEVLKSKIWDEVIIANWDYSSNKKAFFKEKINSFGKRTQIACPGLSDWNTFYPNFKIAISNVKNFIGAAKDENLPGFMVTSWGDDGQECLFSFLNPLILATMEIAEGNGRWEEKWMALSDEDEKITNVRKIFGNSEISTMTLKRVLFGDLYPLYKIKDQKIKKDFEEVLEKTKDVILPDDLEFLRQMIETAVALMNKKARASDFISLSNSYSKLWVKERKMEGLENLLPRFWGMAGISDMKNNHLSGK